MVKSLNTILTAALAAVALCASSADDNFIKSGLWRAYSMGYRVVRTGEFTADSKAIVFLDIGYEDQFRTNQSITCIAGALRGYVVSKWYWAEDERQFDYIRQEYRELRDFAGKREVEINYSMFNVPSVYLAVNYSNLVYGIELDCQVAAGNMSIPVVNYAEWVTLPKNTETKAGYAFAGWATELGGEVAFSDGARVRGSDFRALDDVTDCNAVVKLYAVWVENEFTIATGQTRFGSGQVTPATAVWTKGTALDLSAAPDLGNTFVGWTDGVTASKRKLTVVSNAVYTAKFKPVSYEITFNAGDDASVHPTHKLVTYGSGYGKLPTARSPGRTFANWATERGDAGTPIVSSSIVTSTVPHELYATWKALYSVAFIYYDANGIQRREVTKVLSGESAEPPADAVVNRYIGHRFREWSGNYRKVTQDETVIAQYDENRYAIRFNANGGVGAMEDEPRTYDEIRELSANQFTCDGMRFVGWSQLSNATEAAYVDCQSVGRLCSENGGIVNLYAVWTAKSNFIVTFQYYDANSALQVTNVVVREGMSVEDAVVADLTQRASQYLGHVFTDWNGSYRNVTSDRTIIANYGENRYTIHFDANGGVGAMVDESRTYDEFKALSANQFTRENMRFVGWSQLSNATEAAYVDRQLVGCLCRENGGVVTLYAVWADKAAYIVRFQYYDANSALQVLSVTVSEGADAEPPADELVSQYPGHVFTGWNGSYRNVTSDRTIKAEYTSSQYVIHFNANGGVGAMSDELHSFTDTFNLPANRFTPADATQRFVGWSTDAAATVIMYSDCQSVSRLCTGTEITLYAVWTAKSNFIVTFQYYDANSALQVTNVVVSEGADVIETADALAILASQYPGHVFTGWNGSYRNVTSDRTIRAVYDGTQYTVYFDPHGGSGTMPAEVHGYEETWNLPTCRFSPPAGKVFLGWSQDAAAVDAAYGDEARVSQLCATNGGSVTLYAVWTDQAVHTVHFMYYTASAAYVTNDVKVISGHDATPPEYAVVSQYPGHAFTGWSGDNYVNVTSERWVEAQYQCNQYIICFHSNIPDQLDNVHTQICEYGYNETLDKANFKYPGHDFLYWSTTDTATVTGQTYSDGESVKNLTTENGGVVDLYAVWSSIKLYNVDFVYRDSDDNWVTYEPQQHIEYGKTAYPPATNIVNQRTEWEFKQWWPQSYTNVTSDLVITAEYEKVELYYVKFDPNDAHDGSKKLDDEIKTLSFRVGKEATLPTNEFTYGASPFLGWNTDSNAVKGAYTNTLPVDFAKANTTNTLYAIWGYPSDLSAALGCKNLKWENGNENAQWTSTVCDSCMCVEGKVGAVLKAHIDGNGTISFSMICSKVGDIVTHYGVTSGSVEPSTSDGKECWQDSCLITITGVSSAGADVTITVDSNYDGNVYIKNLTWPGNNSDESKSD